MLAECELLNLAEPEAYETFSGKAEQRDSYAPTVSGRPLARVIPIGPRMQMRTHLDVADRRYFLKGIFIINMSRIEEGVYASHRDLPVQAHGPDAASAIREFSQFFDFQWRNLVEVSEDQLTEGGIARRRAMMAAVEKVEAL